MTGQPILYFKFERMIKSVSYSISFKIACVVLMILITDCLKTHGQTFIPTPPGPEDMVLDTFDGRVRLLVSCAQRRLGMPAYSGIQEIDPETFASKPLLILDSSFSFRNPHGMDIVKLGNNVFLYVIAHDFKPGIQGVFRFKVSKESLELDRIFVSPLFESPNALTVFPDGSFLVSNDAGQKGNKAEILFGRAASKLIYCAGDGSACEETGLPVAYGNGVLADLNNQRLYHASSRSGKVFVYKLQGKTLTERQLLCRIKTPDNLRFSSEGVLVASHSNPFRFIRHMKDPLQRSPGKIFVLPEQPGKAKVIFEDDGSRISAPSTALIWKDLLFVCQVFNEGIWVNPLKK